MDVLASGLCTRVDLYGYTAKGSAKYFNRGRTMNLVHIMVGSDAYYFLGLCFCFAGSSVACYLCLKLRLCASMVQCHVMVRAADILKDT